MDLTGKSVEKYFLKNPHEKELIQSGDFYRIMQDYGREEMLIGATVRGEELWADPASERKLIKTLKKAHTYKILKVTALNNVPYVHLFDPHSTLNKVDDSLRVEKKTDDGIYFAVLLSNLHLYFHSITALIGHNCDCVHRLNGQFMSGAFQQLNDITPNESLCKSRFQYYIEVPQK